jgi:transcriptional regulator with XRE-family HTH domain
MQSFTVEQAVAARAFLGWTQHELSEASGLSFETIRDFEHDELSTTTKSVDAIRTAFHDTGVEFQRHGKRVGITIVMPWQTM